MRCRSEAFQAPLSGRRGGWGWDGAAIGSGIAAGGIWGEGVALEMGILLFLW